MEGLNSRTKFTISLILSLVVLLSGVAVLAQEGEETQTPSEQVGEGAREVIEGVLTEYDFEDQDFEGSPLEEAKSLIDAGVPPGIMVSVVKSLETGHLSVEELDSAFKDLETNIVEEGKPPGQVIKSIKTTYDLPEEEAEAEEKGKPDEAGPPDDKGQNGESEDGDDKGQSEDKGPPEDEEEGEDEGKSDEAGPPEEKGQDGESEAEGNNGPPEDKGNSDEAGPPEEEEGEEE